jgi:hypothetical protein
MERGEWSSGAAEAWAHCLNTGRRCVGKRLPWSSGWESSLAYVGALALIMSDERKIRGNASSAFSYELLMNIIPSLLAL